MPFDIIKEQRMIRSLFYSLIHAADLIINDNNLKEQFVSNVSKFIRERVLSKVETRELNEVARELIEILGWKSIRIDVNVERGEGKILLGKNRYIINEIEDLNGTLIVLQAFFEGICSFLINAPVQVKANLSLTSNSHYEVDFKRFEVLTSETKEVVTATPKEIIDKTVHESFTKENIFVPIFGREIPMVILFEVIWKVVSESYIANYSIENDQEACEALKSPSMENLSLLILKLIEGEDDTEILHMAELTGEFFVRVLKTRISASLHSKLLETLQDKQANNYFIYYDCRIFCAEKKFVNRCSFIRGMWIGILSEIFGFQVKIKELYHAGKRDRYCMLELIPEKES